MGESIDRTDFTRSDEELFNKKLRAETQVLKNMFDSRAFEYSEKPCLGLEVEGWLVNEDNLPSPCNQEFFLESNHPDIVEELSKFNFEINVDPEMLEKNCFQKMHKNISDTWKLCLSSGEKIKANPMLVGIHPLIRDQDLQLECLSDGGRYKALNNQIFKLRKNKPMHVDIKGLDHFQMDFNHIMLEAATTSIQVHIQANQDNMKRLYNASLISSIPSVAVAANSPFLYGHSLWDETRIPLFEQAVNIASFRDKKGADIGRVTFGTGYIRNSPLELFLENLDGYPPLLPALFDDPPEKLRHLKIHNGTLWRWNRPIVGKNSHGTPHLRIEQRAMASGPTVEDIISNTAFSVGLTQYYSETDKAPEDSMTFTDCKNNFYAAAKNGLNAQVRWFGKNIHLGELILQDLIPKAKKGLLNAGLDSEEVEFYLTQNITQRVRTGQNGAYWQKAFVDRHGKDFQKLTEVYLENQNSERPVHTWEI
ncbi:MAG: hypothetical protein ACRBBP_09975 [Bdellovibrionales bacterium]